LTAKEALYHARDIAFQHFRRMKADIRLPPCLEWRIATAHVKLF
jgi:hypothetical protein